MRNNRPAVSIAASGVCASTWWKQCQEGLRCYPRGSSSRAVFTPDVIDQIENRKFAAGLTNDQLRELTRILAKSWDEVAPKEEIERIGLNFIREAVRNNIKVA